MQYQEKEEYPTFDCITGGRDEAWLSQIYQNRCWRRPRQFSFLAVNIKKFTKYNLRYGREVSDRILKNVYLEIYGSF